MANHLTICSGLNEFFDSIREVFALGSFYASLSKGSIASVIASRAWWGTFLVLAGVLALLRPS